jgi:hypothetical protein
MSTYLTIWHYLALLLGFLVFVLTVILAFNEKRPSTRNAVIIASIFVNAIIGFVIMMAIDKYTKKAEVFNLQNHRILQTEQIVFTGVVKNVGNYTIGQVKLEIKLVNKGHVSGNVKAGTFYKPSGFLDFFGGPARDYQPQTLIETPIIAENLKPGESRQFRVAFPYPPYFKGVTQFNRIFSH